MPPETVTITFTKDQMQVLNDALVLAPYGKVAPLVASINQQIQTQMQPAPVAVEAAPAS